MNGNKEMILVVSHTESFLAKSLVGKLGSNGAEVLLSKDLKEIDSHRNRIALTILFMDEGIVDMGETLVYLKDMANDTDGRIILIGDQAAYDSVIRIITDTLVLEWFKRPLVMDDLIKSVSDYMDENTGENAKKTVLIVDDDITYMRTVY